VTILGVSVAVNSYGSVVTKSLEWAKTADSRVLVFANVHVVMEAVDSPSYRDCLNRADIVSPDGVPLVWALKLLGKPDASRVYGPDCTIAMLKSAAESGVPVGFYGGSPEVLETLLTVVRRDYPSLKITFSMSPPFRQLTAEEDDEVVRKIADSGTRVLFVGLGCPKQERWMIEHRERVPAVMFGVGAAFDFIAGSKKQAPRWMMNSGLEWIFRFATEPRRLAQRYLKNNPRFVLLFAWQLLTGRTRGPRDPRGEVVARLNLDVPHGGASD
jgi:N-acetylglucosaminyldiphosphoundecaprenol N-acetyl-beta-D-mannosaminyltransferase